MRKRRWKIANKRVTRDFFVRRYIITGTDIGNVGIVVVYLHKWNTFLLQMFAKRRGLVEM